MTRRSFTWNECLFPVGDGGPGQSFADTPSAPYLHGGLVRPACHQEIGVS
jgi:hypothetical protein